MSCLGTTKVWQLCRILEFLLFLSSTTLRPVLCSNKPCPGALGLPFSTNPSTHSPRFPSAILVLESPRRRRLSQYLYSIRSSMVDGVTAGYALSCFWTVDCVRQGSSSQARRRFLQFCSDVSVMVFAICISIWFWRWCVWERLSRRRPMPRVWEHPGRFGCHGSFASALPFGIEIEWELRSWN